ncbi:hypothetical protein [Vibrio phage CKB-S1]|nr:hypothetical protein [Vibrio phage CKB-S1]
MMEAPKTWYEYGLKRPHSRKFHYVGELNDGNQVVVMYKWYVRSKQAWYYGAEPRWLLEQFHWGQNDD